MANAVDTNFKDDERAETTTGSRSNAVTDDLHKSSFGWLMEKILTRVDLRQNGREIGNSKLKQLYFHMPLKYESYI